jgi:hypothetical protein
VKASNHPFRDKRIYARALPQAGANAIKYVKACSRQLHAGKAELIWAGAESERKCAQEHEPKGSLDSKGFTEPAHSRYGLVRPDRTIGAGGDLAIRYLCTAQQISTSEMD